MRDLLEENRARDAAGLSQTPEEHQAARNAMLKAHVRVSAAPFQAQMNAVAATASASMKAQSAVTAAAANAAVAAARDEFVPRLKKTVNGAYVTRYGNLTGAHGGARGAVPYRIYVARVQRLTLPQRRPVSRSVRRVSRRVRSTAASRDGPCRQADDPHLAPDRSRRKAVAA